MKSWFIAVVVGVCCMADIAAAQWLDGGTKQSQNVRGNGALLVYKGKMYFWNEEHHFQVSSDNGTTWSDPSDSIGGANPHVRNMTATSDRLFAGLNFGTGNGIVISSTDEGVTWLPDTAGAPGHALGWGGMPVVHDLYAWGHWLYVIWDRPVPYTMNDINGPFVFNDYLNQGVNNPSSVIAKGDTLFLASNAFFYTIDGGANFVTPANNGYPGPGGRLLVDGSRIYLFARKVFNKPVALYYSDDNGDNWTEIDISSVMSHKIVNGDLYFPDESFIKGNRIEFATTQETFSTPPNVWASTNLGATWTQDTAGIPTSFVCSVVNFAYTPDGSLWCVKDLENIYRQKIDAGIAAVHPRVSTAHGLSISPNPAHDEVHVGLATDGAESYTLYDIFGREVASHVIETFASGVDISTRQLPAGAYQIVVRFANGTTSASMLVKQ